MPWRLIVAPRAERDMAGLSPHDRESVRRALRRTSTDPGSMDIKKLRGSENRWRLRVGRWRAILELRNEAGEIRVLRVLPRGRAYRD
jgi:mRNA interferase RelE/StbE